MVYSQARPYFEDWFCLGSVSENHPGTAKCPEPLLPHAGVTAMREASRASWKSVTPSSSLIRAHAPDLCPPPAFGFASCDRSLQVAASPCCAKVLPDVISADLSPRVWTPTPVAPRVHAPVSSPKALAFPAFEPGRRFTTPQQLLLSGFRFRSCSHSLMFRPASLLATPVAPTLTSHDVGQPWLLHPRLSRFVTSPCSGHANRPNREIGGKRTFTPQNRQPCRLLLKRSKSITPPNE